MAVKFLELPCKLKLLFQTFKTCSHNLPNACIQHFIYSSENVFQILYSQSQPGRLTDDNGTQESFACKLRNYQACFHPDLHSGFCLCFPICPRINELKVSCPVCIVTRTTLFSLTHSKPCPSQDALPHCDQQAGPSPVCHPPSHLSVILKH